MPEAPSHPQGGGLAAVNRKLGPLPVWAWAGVVVIGFLLYRHFKGGSSTGQPQQPTTDQAYVPGFDAASMSGGGGIGSTGTPSTVTTTNNYYYGDLGAAQAAGGGTSPGGPAKSAPPPATKPPPVGYPGGGTLPGPNVPYSGGGRGTNTVVSGGTIRKPVAF